jgi:hypothetical protein
MRSMLTLRGRTMLVYSGSGSVWSSLDSDPIPDSASFLHKLTHFSGHFSRNFCFKKSNFYVTYDLGRAPDLDYSKSSGSSQEWFVPTAKLFKSEERKIVPQVYLVLWGLTAATVLRYEHHMARGQHIRRTHFTRVPYNRDQTMEV